MRRGERFEAKADDGRVFTVIEITSTVRVDNQGGQIDGLSDLRTTQGHTVTPLGDGLYEIVDLGLRVRRVP